MKIKEKKSKKIPKVLQMIWTAKEPQCLFSPRQNKRKQQINKSKPTTATTNKPE